MTLSPLDSPLWQGLYRSDLAHDALGDTALIAAMVRVEIALAHACETAGLTPPGSGPRIAAALSEARIDPADLAPVAARDGVPVPALLAVLRARLAEADADALHLGATSQDVVDTATILCLGDFARRLGEQVDACLDLLAGLAAREADTVQLARTRTQGAVPTTFGSVVAGWGSGLAAARARLAAAAEAAARVSLHGAAGTDSVLGGAAEAVRADMARRLGLTAPASPWHTDRQPICALADAVAALAAQCGRIGADLALLAATGITEVRLEGGGSSAMPHKANPVRAEAAVALARHAAHLQGAVTEAAIHPTQRDGAAWGLEWLSLRPLCGAAAAASENVHAAVASLQVDRAAMARTLAAAGIAPYSERLTNLVAETTSRKQARAAVTRALAEPDPEATLRREHPQIDWTRALDPLTAAGNAPAQARAFGATRGETP